MCEEPIVGCSTLLFIANTNLLLFFQGLRQIHFHFAGFNNVLSCYRFILVVVHLQELTVVFYRLRCLCWVNGLIRTSDLFKVIFKFLLQIICLKRMFRDEFGSSSDFIKDICSISCIIFQKNQQAAMSLFLSFFLSFLPSFFLSFFLSVCLSVFLSFCRFVETSQSCDSLCYT